MSRTSRMLGGLAFGYGNQIVLTLVGLWLTRFLLARLGQSDYGLWLVGTRILGYLLLLDIGVVALLPRETAFATGRAGSIAAATELPEIVGRTMRIVLWQLPAVAAISLLVWLLLPTEWEAFRLPLACVLVTFVVTFPTRVFREALTGLQDLAFLGATFTLTWVAGTAVTVALVLAGWGLYALAVGWSVTQALAAVAWWARLKRTFPAVLPRRLPRFASGEGLRDRLTRGAWVSLGQIAHVLVQGTDLLIIGKLLGPGAVVPYMCTGKLMAVLANQPQMLAQTAQPALSELRTSRDRDRLHLVSAALTRAVLMLSGAIVCVVVFLNEGFVRWWVGPAQYGGLGLTVVLLAGMLLRHVNLTASYSLFALGHDKRLSITGLADGAVTAAAAIVLTRSYGVLGTACGTIIGLVLVALPANGIALARETGVHLRRLVLDLWPVAWRFALALTAVLALSQAWRPRGLAALAGAGLASAAIYAGIVGPLALREPLRPYVQPRLAALAHAVTRVAARGRSAA